MRDNTKAFSVRFHLDKPLYKKAYDFLESQRGSTKNKVIATALVDYFDNQERENRLVEKIKIALAEMSRDVAATESKVAKRPPENLDDIVLDDIDIDFLGG